MGAGGTCLSVFFFLGMEVRYCGGLGGKSPGWPIAGPDPDPEWGPFWDPGEPFWGMIRSVSIMAAVIIGNGAMKLFKSPRFLSTCCVTIESLALAVVSISHPSSNCSEQWARTWSVRSWLEHKPAARLFLSISFFLATGDDKLSFDSKSFPGSRGRVAKSCCSQVMCYEVTVAAGFKAMATLFWLLRLDTQQDTLFLLSFPEVAWSASNKSVQSRLPDTSDQVDGFLDEVAGRWGWSRNHAEMFPSRDIKIWKRSARN